MRAVGADTSGEDVTADATWVSSNPDVVTVQAGVVSAVGAGTVTVTASVQGQTVSIRVVARRNVVVTGTVSITGPPMLCTNSGILDYGLWLFLDGSRQGLPSTHSAFGCGVTLSTVTLAYSSSSLNTPADPSVAPGRHELRAQVYLSSSQPSITVTSTTDSFIALMDRDTSEIVARVPLGPLSALAAGARRSWTSSGPSMSTCISRKRHVRRTPTLHLTVIVAAALVASCGGSSSAPTAPTPPQKAAIADLVLSEGALSVARHSLTQITATLKRVDGSTEDVTWTATWASSNPEIASVQQGLIVGVDRGTATLSVGYGGVLRSLDVEVRRNTFADGGAFVYLTTPVRDATQVIERMTVSIDGADTGACAPIGNQEGCEARFGNVWPPDGHIDPGPHEISVRFALGPSAAGTRAEVSAYLALRDGDSGETLWIYLFDKQDLSLSGASCTWRFEAAVWR